METTLDPLVLDLVEWVAVRPRRYAEAMEAWRTSCPRLPVWEEAITNGLVRRTSGATMRDAKIVITDKGRQALKTAHVSQTAIFVSGKSARPN